MLTFQYYAINAKIKDPPMSDKLRAMLEKAANGQDWHIVHLGTVGDARHKLNNPRSKHNRIPPDAIDILKVYFTDDGEKCCADMRNLASRLELAKRIIAAGGKTAHATDKRKKHLHAEV